ncbi:MAG: CDP-diacylglycerol--glycerol-3-phosphate 3-phosphatidyltransferase [Clostridia bacterium]|nr:CDP-diacylglycerol--glycerol-3-phosphate 3-phosphatidyltransferase [Clostridia bacterium]
MAMNLPNKLTIARIVLTPIFLLVFTISSIPYHYLIALVLYFIASMTDYFDGKIARRDNIITNFGKFTDPLADKMLTTAAFLGFMAMGYCNLWIVFIILFREFLVSSIRLVASAQGVVIPANMWGKVKTASMMLFTGFLMILLTLQCDFGILPEAFPMAIVSNVLFGINAVLTIISGITYVLDGAKIIDFSK